MALLNQPIQVPAQIGGFFAKIRDGQAPEKFNRDHLIALGYTSSNHYGFLPLLKGLGFLSSDGVPTARYREYLNSTRSRQIMAEAIREAYGDIFVIKAKPTRADKDFIVGKFRSAFNSSEISADRAASTFLALMELADEAALYKEASSTQEAVRQEVAPNNSLPINILNGADDSKSSSNQFRSSLHYNIQIHLPATKDLEVYNAIFKVLRAHVIE